MSEGQAKTAPETRKLAAIMFTDIVGFSRQMGANETRTLRLLEVHNHIIEQAVAAHRGHVIKTAGDGFLVEFPSVVHAVQCAQQIQAQLRAHNGEQEKDEQIHLRIGVHLGDMVVQPNGDVLGDGVNIASRLQTLAEPDTICISDMVYRDVAQKVPLGTVISLGRPKLKNIAQRFPIYALLSEQPTGLPHTLRRQGLRFRRAATAHLSWAALVVGVVVGGAIIALLSPSSLTPIPRPALRDQEPLPLPDKPSIAVLPFVNISGDPKQEYFSDGLTEELITSLSKLSGLFIVARHSVFTYKGKAVKVQEVRRELGVRYVLEGSVRKASSRVLITTQLVDATTGYHLWSERYDRELQDIFALQEEITRKIMVQLAIRLTEAEEQKQVWRQYTSNVEAWDTLCRGAAYYSRYTKEANAQARQLYEQAIELDPTYALAYTGLGWSYYMEWVWQWSQDLQSLERAFEWAQKAIALDDSLPASHVLLSVVFLFKKQHDQAIVEAKRAVALNPNGADGYLEMGLILNYAGQPEEAIEMVEKAMRLNPRYSSDYLWILGAAYLLTERYEEAIAIQKQALNLNPNMLASHLALVVIYSELGRI